MGVRNAEVAVRSGAARVQADGLAERALGLGELALADEATPGAGVARGLGVRCVGRGARGGCRSWVRGGRAGAAGELGVEVGPAELLGNGREDAEQGGIVTAGRAG